MISKNSKKTILIFAGAGASKAVSPDDYPTTVEFFKRLPKKFEITVCLVRCINL